MEYINMRGMTCPQGTARYLLVYTQPFNNPQMRLKCIQVDTVDTSVAQVLVISLR